MREQLSRCEKCVYYVRSGMTFLMSHLGLVALVIGYTVMGGFAFEAIEKGYEKDKRLDVIMKRTNIVDTLWTMTKEPDVLVKQNWTEQAKDQLKKFEQIVMEAMNDGYDGNDEGQLQWSFPGALFFSIIVITTIGYGHITPKTSLGKIITILYAIVGIPLLLLCLSSIGDIMANSFKFIYWKVCCYLCIQPKKRTRSQRHRFTPEMTPEYEKSPPESPLMQQLDQNFFNNKFPQDYSPATPAASPLSLSSPKFPTIQSKHSQSKYDTYCNNIDVSGVPIIPNKYVMQCDGDIQEFTAPTLLNIPTVKNQSDTSKESSDQANWSKRKEQTTNEDLMDDDDDDSGTEATEDEISEVTVPVSLCAMVVIGYIAGGSALFMKWEDWSFEDSWYFCFITLTTIGFGDMVPGASVISDHKHHLSLILCSLYLLFGMALIAMSFNLVQEEVTKTLKEVGKRIGIISEDDDN